MLQLILPFGVVVVGCEVEFELVVVESAMTSEEGEADFLWCCDLETKVAYMDASFPCLLCDD